MIHILNGDSLFETFPVSIIGSKIVMRECLVEGPLSIDFTELLLMRDIYLSETYSGKVDPTFYNENVIPELNAIHNIASDRDVSLWFEEDLFCQVNLWYCLYVLKNHRGNISLVKPDAISPYGFAAYDENGLEKLFQNKISIRNLLPTLSSLWPSLVSENFHELDSVARTLSDIFPFISMAVESRKSMSESHGGSSKFATKIITLIEEKDIHTFPEFFKAFSQEFPYYGFGDLMMERIYHSLTQNRA